MFSPLYHVLTVVPRSPLRPMLVSKIRAWDEGGSVGRSEEEKWGSFGTQDGTKK